MLQSVQLRSRVKWRKMRGRGIGFAFWFGLGLALVARRKMPFQRMRNRGLQGLLGVAFSLGSLGRP